jgi:hypothetical protein
MIGENGLAAAAGPDFRAELLPLREHIRKLDLLIEKDRSLAEDLAARRIRLRAGARNLEEFAAVLAERALTASVMGDHAALESAAQSFAERVPQAGDYLGDLNALRRGLETGQTLDRSRAAVFESLSSAVRTSALHAAADMTASARSADAALHGAVLTLVAAMGLGCVLAVGAAGLLLRTARKKRSGP